MIERQQAWRYLFEDSAKFDLPWLLAGDFNCTLSNSERVTTNSSLNANNDFQDFVLNLGLKEVNSLGSFYAWRGGLNFYIHSKLDRVLGNFESFSCTPNLHVKVLTS